MNSGEEFMPEMVAALANDGLNMAADENKLYIRCKRDIYIYNRTDMSEAAHSIIFKKDGKARGISVFGDFIYLTDFCDLYILNKNDLQVLEVYRIGNDLSSDLGAVRFDASNAYIGIRNGKIAVLNLLTHDLQIHSLCDSSFWDFCVVKNRIYAGTVGGELLEINTEKMLVLRKVSLGRKNIYSVLQCGQFLYTVSQDMSITAIDINTLEVTFQAKKAVRGMAKILGCYEESLIVADSNKVSFWQINTLQHQKTIGFPTGRYNKGALLWENKLVGSNFSGIYQLAL